MALEPAKLSDFRLAGALGAGTTARVYEATHLATGRLVAIKVIAEPGQSHDHGREIRERFAREALLLANVESRHVSKILGFGFDKGQPFLVLERLQGETLDAKLRRDGPVPALTAIRWIEQLIVGVRDCHDKKVIHRDIKPGNIFLHQEGGRETVKLIDFGVARLREITRDTGGLTSASHVLGSMGYMAPEQFKSAKTVGYSADLYAVGIVIFRTLTGRLPFVSRSLEAIIRMKSEHQMPSISSMPGMAKNPLLDWFVLKATAREPEVRFQNAREMLDHWWNVMASVDEEDSTDIMRGIGRVDESYAGLRPEPRGRIPLPSQARSSSSAHGHPSAPLSLEEEIDEENVRTIRRPERSSTSSGRSWGDRTEPGFSLVESAPLTVPSHGVPVGGPDETTLAGSTVVPDVRRGTTDDPFDLPTRSDPSLRKLVERELELQKARRGQGE